MLKIKEICEFLNKHDKTLVLQSINTYIFENFQMPILKKKEPSIEDVVKMFAISQTIAEVELMIDDDILKQLEDEFKLRFKSAKNYINEILKEKNYTNPIYLDSFIKFGMNKKEIDYLFTTYKEKINKLEV